MSKSEEQIVKKALERDDNTGFLNRAFPYVSESRMIESLKNLYPELNHLLICDLDARDKHAVPLLKTKQLRPIYLNHIRTICSNGHSYCSMDVKMRFALVVVENGQVYIKLLTTGGESKHK